ncbi:MAG: competence/damage-inducible protein A [Deltaproteobacteria bacterium]|nr:MAG: competence/damage-inducible protein A [Deltaproteobacteria bacterium]
MIERAAILSTGDEITTGKVVDTNANYLADKLVEAGIEVVTVITVGDVADRIVWAWQQALAQADVIISTGGIGPTADDLTTELVAKVAGVELFFSEEVAERIRRVFASLNRPMPENNLKQAHFPAGSTIIPNHLGTAPGYRVDLDTPHGRKHLIILPGVPREMKPMMEETVLPWLREMRGGGEVFLSRTFQTFGISESGLDELVAGTVREDEGRLAFRASFPQISMRVTVRGQAQEAEARLAELSNRIRARIGSFVYGEGDVTMEEVVGQLLKDKGKTLGLAEACSGGLVSHRLTNVPGSSAYFQGTVVAYSEAAKTRLLGVKPETLRQYGAVSEETVREMAVGVRERLGTDIGIAVTGIAGPDGGTPEKPIGTACLALSADGTLASRRYQLWGNREWIKTLVSQLVLDWVRRALLGVTIAESGFIRR